MNEKAVPPSYFKCKLAYCFQKRLGFDVACRSADFNDAYVCACFVLVFKDEFFYFVRYMGNNLHCLSKIFAVPLFVQDVPVHSAGSEV